jgi:hypothetical protein
MIQVMSFEEWETAQNPETMYEWGSTAKSGTSEMIHNKMSFKDMPPDARLLFYRQYVAFRTNPIGKRIDIENIQP